MNFDTHKHWNSLVALEQAGVSEYPGLAQLAGIPPTSIAGRSAVALNAQQSLIIRLLVRRPLYAHYVCDMQLDRNLRRENERWTIHFRAKEIGAERVYRRPSAYRAFFPNDLVSQLEEFLAVWRPMLPGADLPELFTTLAGRTFSVLALNNGIKRTTYAHTGRATDARQIRTIWATEFIKKTEDFVAAAEILGDTVESVLRRFAHLRREDPGILADRFFAHTVEDQIESRCHRAQTLG